MRRSYAPRMITELRRFGRARMTRLALLVAVLIPLLYGALYLWAFWNPTGNLERVPVAVVNVDSGATTDDGTVLHAGEEIATELVRSDSLEWHETSPTEAARGLEDGRYYATVTIPTDFSEAVSSLGSDDPEQATLDVRYDDANGYTARTIVSSVMREVRAGVSTSIGEEAVGELLVGFSDIHSGLEDASRGADDLADGTQESVEGVARLESGAADLDRGAGGLAEGVGTARAGADDVDAGAAALDTGTREVATGAAELAEGSRTLDEGAARLDEGAAETDAGAERLASGLSTLERRTRTLSAETDRLADGAEQVAAGNRQIADAVSTATGRAGTAVTELEALVEQLPDDDPRREDLQGALARVRAEVDAVDTQTATLADGAEQVAEGSRALASGSADLRQGIVAADEGADALAEGTGRLAAGADELHRGTSTLSAGAGALSTGAGELADGAGTLHAGTTSLAQGLATLDDGADRLAAGADRLHTGVGTLSDGLVRLDDGAEELASGLDDALSSVPDWDQAERAANAEAMSSPVGLDTAFSHEAATNGEGLAPYFIGLSLYVGALILWMLLRPVNRRALAAPVKALRVVLAGYLPAVLLGILQAVLLMTVLVQLLGLDLAHPFAAIGFALLVSAAFIAFQQAVNVLLGPAVGRVVVLVFLMLQLTSAGGTYPAITSAGFFQALHGVLPMTQVVDGLREAITGDLNQTFITAVAYLGGLLVASIVVSTWAARRQRTWTMTRLHPEVSL